MPQPNSRATSWYLRVDVIALTVAVAVFAAWPELDLAITRRFHDPEHGFYLAHEAWVLLPYYGIDVLKWTLGVAILVVLVAAWLRRLGSWKTPLLFLSAALLLAPGLVVEGVFKNNWGRAKPWQIEQFGGPRQYSAPLVPADQCSRNCSFVSGHAAFGFTAFAFAFLWPRRRRAMIVLGLVLGAYCGAGRIVQGGHFLSDIVFSGFAVWFTLLALDWYWRSGWQAARRQAVVAGLTLWHGWLTLDRSRLPSPARLAPLSTITLSP